jgi:4-coumarate--CoA ligase
LTHSAIADCAVIPKPDEKAGEVPKAFVVLKANVQIKEEEIVEWIKDKVAIHKQLRGGVEFIQAIPKSASGKILRRILVDQERKKSKN